MDCDHEIWQHMPQGTILGFFLGATHMVIHSQKNTGAAFTKCFHNFSTIIPSTILLQANPDAPNSSTQGRIEEELWKNCRKILHALNWQGRRGKIVEEL
jgi:hypothetical protein